jgi:hypothetical protein
MNARHTHEIDFLSNEVLSNCEAKEKLNNDEIQIMTTRKSMVLSSKPMCK